MAAMFGNRKARRPRISISKDDIKKAVSKANDRVKADTAKMQESLKGIQSKAQSTKDEIKKANKELKNIISIIDSRISECNAVESQLFSLNNDLSSLTKKFKKEFSIEKSLRLSVDTLTEKESKLSKAIVLLEKKKEETRSINALIKEAKQEYDTVGKDLLSLKSDQEEDNKAIRALRIAKETVQNEYNESAEKLGLLNAQVKNEIKDMENMLTEKKEYFQVETARLDKMIAERIEELSDNTELANRKAKEYEGMLSKVMIVEKKINDAEDKVKNILASKESSIDQIKKRFETWKLNQLEQVAKLKLKGKIENIDKAGLKDILDV